ncbi:uncharacterized protein LOC132723503 [Ruditapes philippinarum]|uniref:uncharacterized protein LOC132723503 n=1 Tax=Ruditapes philippinarum TaxID=129788 RepID=UPI00295C08D8|nr:uncharacterized protein LOC132723503 [Ruditapes philippinarum]
MNGKNFNKWLNEMLIPNLPPSSVVVVDNAPYHNLQEDKCPTQSTRKAEIQDWLQRHNIAFNQKMLKAELLDMCKRNKPEPVYILDSTLERHGHTCIRLPQYHAELNAIELIWALVKGKVSSENVTFKMTDVLKLTQNAIDNITTEEWKSCCRHVEQVEARFWRSDIALEEAIERIIIHVSDDEETDTASEVGEICSEEESTDTASETDTIM